MKTFNVIFHSRLLILGRWNTCQMINILCYERSEAEGQTLEHWSRRHRGATWVQSAIVLGRQKWNIVFEWIQEERQKTFTLKRRLRFPHFCSKLLCPVRGKKLCFQTICWDKKNAALQKIKSKNAKEKKDVIQRTSICPVWVSEKNKEQTMKMFNSYFSKLMCVLWRYTHQIK